MKRFGAILGLILTLLFTLPWAGTANAADQHEYLSYHQDVSITEDGVATIVLDAEYDFGSTPGHGPMLTFITRMRMEDGRYRLLTTEVLSVTSATGANTKMNFDYSTNTMTLRVGTEGTRFTGVQQYTITYTISGLVEPNHAVSSLDEFNWNNIGNSGNMPHNDVEVRISGPAPVDSGACFQGAKFDVPCETTVDGDSVVLHTNRLEIGEPMQVVAGFPVGSFPNLVPEYVDPGEVDPPWELPTAEDIFTPWKILTAILVSVAGVGGAFALGRRGRDQAYVGVTPGDRPAPGEPVEIGYRDTKAPVAVAFTPPPGIRPAEGEYVLSKGSSPEQASATLIDLAVRGYLIIQQTSKKNFTFLQQQADVSQLVDYERFLLSALFAEGPSVTTKELKKGQHGDITATMNKALSTRVVDQFQWFNRNPVRARTVFPISAVAVGATFAFVFIPQLIFSNPLFIAPIVLIVLAIVINIGKLSHRTPEGSAVLAQVQGFQKYISTAEADQLRWEEGQDVFSRYLPWAIVFGEAERWTKLFQELAAAGQYTQDPIWFYSPYGHFWMGNAWANSMSSFSEALNASVTRAEAFATSGSSAASFGGSGFSGGGGFGGGGSGGW